MIRRSLPIKRGISTNKIAFPKQSCQVRFSSYLCMKFNVFQILRDYIYMLSMKAPNTNFKLLPIPTKRKIHLRGLTSDLCN